MATVLNFSDRGIRWKMTVLDGATGLPADLGLSTPEGTGLFFQSEDEAPRFLPIAGPSMPTPEALQRLSNQDLGRYAQQAMPWPPKGQTGGGAHTARPRPE